MLPLSVNKIHQANVSLFLVLVLCQETPSSCTKPNGRVPMSGVKTHICCCVWSVLLCATVTIVAKLCCIILSCIHIARDSRVQAFHTLRERFPEEYAVFGVAQLVPAMAAPVIKRSLAGWSPLQVTARRVVVVLTGVLLRHECVSQTRQKQLQGFLLAVGHRFLVALFVSGCLLMIVCCDRGIRISWCFVVCVFCLVLCLLVLLLELYLQ